MKYEMEMHFQEGTSENVKEEVLELFWLAGNIAKIADLAFMATGTITNETKKVGTPISSENCCMLFLRGPEKKVNIAMPKIT